MAEQQEQVHTYTIVVNGRQQITTADELNYDKVVKLADPNPPTGPDVLISVTYRRGTGDKPEGTLSPGQIVRLKDGMIFDVVITNKS
jgi:hypothetical protein